MCSFESGLTHKCHISWNEKDITALKLYPIELYCVKYDRFFQ